ncbi:hypothetical protein MASR2M16_02020 [Thauera terpenica]
MRKGGLQLIGRGAPDYTGKLLKAWGPAVTAVATTCPTALPQQDNRGQTTVFSRCPCPSAGCRWAHLSREQLREVVEVV